MKRNKSPLWISFVGVLACLNCFIWGCGQIQDGISSPGDKFLSKKIGEYISEDDSILIDEIRFEGIPDFKLGLACRFGMLTSAVFTANGLYEFPADLSCLTQIKRLNFSGNKIRNFPKHLFWHQLEVLDLSSNQIEGFELTKATYGSIKTLILAGNRLQEFEVDSASAEVLETLDLSMNNLDEFDLCSTPLPKLTFLDLSYNEISQIAFCKEACRNLKFVRLSGNPLERVDGIENIGEVEDMFWDGINASSIEACDCIFPNLTRLSLNGVEGVQHLPCKRIFLPKLERLYLRSCRLEEIPAMVLLMPSLRLLDLEGNRISVLPNWMDKLRKTCQVNLVGNPVSSVE